MRKIFRLSLLSLGFIAIGIVLYWAKLRHDLNVGLGEEFSRRFSAAAAQATVLDEGPPHALGQRDRALIGQAVATEFLISFRVAGYRSEHGSTLPSSLQPIESMNPGGRPFPRDPWGNPYRLLPEDYNRFLIVSVSLLTPEEKDAINKQPVGRAYQLHGKLVLNGSLEFIPEQNSRPDGIPIKQ